MNVCILVCFVLQIVIFNTFILFSVIFRIYEHILKMCFRIFFETKCPRSVNNSRTNLWGVFLWICWDLLVLNGPPPIPRRQYQGSLPGGKM